MPEVLDVNAQTTYVITSSTTPKVWVLDRFFATAIFQVVAASGGPSGTFKISYDGGTTYSDVIVGTGGSTMYAAGTTITLTASSLYLVPCAGATHVKYTRVGGTSVTLAMVGVQQGGITGADGTNALLSAATINEDTAAADLEILMKGGSVRRDTPATSAGTTGDWATVNQDANGAAWTSLATLIAGENLTTNRMMVEHAYSYWAPVAVDTLVKSGAGFLHTFDVAQADAAPTAGTISVLDATSAGTGTSMWTWNLTTAVFTPFPVIKDVAFNTGLFLDFTTTADVNVSGSYR